MALSTFHESYFGFSLRRKCARRKKIKKRYEKTTLALFNELEEERVYYVFDEKTNYICKLGMGSMDDLIKFIRKYVRTYNALE